MVTAAPTRAEGMTNISLQASVINAAALPASVTHATIRVPRPWLSMIIWMMRSSVATSPPGLLISRMTAAGFNFSAFLRAFSKSVALNHSSPSSVGPTTP